MCRLDGKWMCIKNEERGEREQRRKKESIPISILIYGDFLMVDFFQLFASCSDFNFFPSALFLFWFLQIWLTITFKLYKKKETNQSECSPFFFHFVIPFIDDLTSHYMKMSRFAHNKTGKTYISCWNDIGRKKCSQKNLRKN